MPSEAIFCFANVVRWIVWDKKAGCTKLFQRNIARASLKDRTATSKALLSQDCSCWRETKRWWTRTLVAISGSKKTKEKYQRLSSVKIALGGKQIRRHWWTGTVLAISGSPPKAAFKTGHHFRVAVIYTFEEEEKPEFKESKILEMQKGKVFQKSKHLKGQLGA